MRHAAQFDQIDPDTLREYAKEGAAEVTRRGTRYRFTPSDSHRGGVIRAAQKKIAQQQERQD